MPKINGLTSEKASKLLQFYGLNEIREKPKTSLILTFISQFTSLLVFLLIIASLGSILLGDTLDGIFILLIVILNGVLGFIQEYRAERAIAALKNMTISTVRVIRDGIEQKIESKFITPGDVIILTEGDKIPADCNLIESHHLEVSEAALSGESFPITKSSNSPSENKIYMGTIITRGRCMAIVDMVGMNTKFGQIAESLEQIKEIETPLQKKLTLLGKQLGALAIISSVIVFTAGFLKGREFIETTLTSISLAVAAVPEGLPAVITITLALGMERMAKKRAILRKLSSIEALGGITIIATDKTGTLTKNEMHVTKYWINSDEKLDDLIKAGVICNNASLVFKHDHGGFDVLGDTTEGSLLLFARASKYNIAEIKAKGKLVEEFSFDPKIKLMTVVWDEDGQKTVYTKGAPESILDRCKNIGASQMIKYQKIFEEYAKEGLRVIAIAKKNITSASKNRRDIENDLNLIGIVGISDPPRTEVRDAIEIADLAGIKTIMITGDNELTANAIATKIGLIKKDEEIITGKQFADLTDEEALSHIDKVRIFARTSPDQKLRIVKLLQAKGHIVAVTGDGVNDALAIKQANVGVAMGISGTDVAKEASDMIITDDNYATLVSAVEEGRTIFDNIKSAVKYLVGCNMGEIVAVLIGMLLGWPLILTPLQLLYVNLVTDGLPAIALAATEKHVGIMKRKPKVKKNIFENIDFVWFLEVSILTAGATLFAFWFGMRTGSIETARALAFTTIVLVQHFILLDIRVRDQSLFNVNILKDRFFMFAFSFPLILQIFILYIPYLENIFKIKSVAVAELIIITVVSSTLLLSSEVRKILVKSFQG